MHGLGVFSISALLWSCLLLFGYRSALPSLLDTLFFAFALAFGSLGRRIPLKRIRIRPLEVVGVLMFAWKAFGILIPTLRTLRVFSVLGYPAKN